MVDGISYDYAEVGNMILELEILNGTYSIAFQIFN
jgi:hypothetical protein